VVLEPHHLLQGQASPVLAAAVVVGIHEVQRLVLPLVVAVQVATEALELRVLPTQAVEAVAAVFLAHQGRDNLEPTVALVL
jgi:hypothetical protein